MVVFVTVAFLVPAAGVEIAVAVAVAVNVWSRDVGAGGVAFKSTSRTRGRDCLQQQQHSIH